MHPKFELSNQVTQVYSLSIYIFILYLQNSQSSASYQYTNFFDMGWHI